MICRSVACESSIFLRRSCGRQINLIPPPQSAFSLGDLVECVQRGGTHNMSDRHRQQEQERLRCQLRHSNWCTGVKLPPVSFVVRWLANSDRGTVMFDAGEFSRKLFGLPLPVSPALLPQFCCLADARFHPTQAAWQPSNAHHRANGGEASHHWSRVRIKLGN